MKKQFEIYKNNIDPSHDILINLSRSAMAQPETEGRNSIVNALIDGAMALKALKSEKIEINNKGQNNERYRFDIEVEPNKIKKEK